MLATFFSDPDYPAWLGWAMVGFILTPLVIALVVAIFKR